jgi:urease accessory protein
MARRAPRRSARHSRAVGYQERGGVPRARPRQRRARPSASGQGLLLAGVGLDERIASTVSAHALSVSVVSAALRLSVITHVDAQRILTAVRRLLAELLAEPVLDVAQAAVYTPATDVAAMRHESQTARLFAN